jgi:hypothetical protein
MSNGRIRLTQTTFKATLAVPQNPSKAISMKKPLSALITLLVLLAIPAGAAVRKTAKPPKPADLLKKAVEAMGGAANVDAVKALELHGSSKRSLPNGQEWSLETVSYYIFPDRYRQEAKLPVGGTLVTMVGPQGAFLQTGESAGVQLPDEQKVEIGRSIQRNPLMILQRRNSLKPTVEPSEKIDGKDAVVLRFEEEIGPTKVAVDPKTGEILQVTYSTAGGIDSKLSEMTITYSDYRPVGNVRFPYASSGTVGGKPAFAFKASEVVVNGKLEEKLFSPGAVEPAEAKTKPW